MSLVSRVAYRIRQFVRAAGARPSAADLALLDRYLSPAEQRLFHATSPRDQDHHLRTLQLLQRRGTPDATLARAALLHDVGKGYIRLHERVVYVLLAAAAPALLRRLTRRPRRGLLGALYRTRHHAAAGASMLRSLGVEDRVLDLVARHHRPAGGDAALCALIEADNDA
jgi:putative nucleotidyltransferase with HDIG domain